jgi:hypothetical protein
MGKRGRLKGMIDSAVNDELDLDGWEESARIVEAFSAGQSVEKL